LENKAFPHKILNTDGQSIGQKASLFLNDAWNFFYRFSMLYFNLILECSSGQFRVRERCEA
ncbi:hypothetical protein OBB02_04390, partial [Candidatus Puniceispirillum sp.]|nr:hypothetical protein [Candidatus Puniceispirillum sp.]